MEVNDDKTEQDPDHLSEAWIWIHTKMSWIRNTARNSTFGENFEILSFSTPSLLSDWTLTVVFLHISFYQAEHGAAGEGGDRQQDAQADALQISGN